MFSPSGKLQGLESGHRERGARTWFRYSSNSGSSGLSLGRAGVGREQMRLNRAPSVVRAVICASAGLLIINHTKSKQEITLDAFHYILRKGFYLCLDRFIPKLGILFTEEYKSIRPIVTPLMR